MKAWMVWDEGDDYDYRGNTVVFAENRGKAKSLARYTDTCEDTEWVDIRAIRFREMDCMFRGMPEMDWDNPQDRLALVKAGWSCIEMMNDECKECAAKDFCNKYQDYLHDMKEERRA